jgi:PPOX class probable F420-dependent enzyme
MVMTTAPAIRPERSSPVHHSRRDNMPTRAIDFVAAMRVARLATIGADGTPSQVPICFAVLDGDAPVIVSVLDDKPKRVGDAELARVRNIRRDSRVSLVVDHYEEDWSRLAFVQLRGRARIVDPGEEVHAAAIAALREKYPQYRAMAIERRPVILVDDLRASSWGIS